MSSESMREVGGLQSILLYMLSILVFFIPNSQQNTKKNLWDLLMVQTVGALRQLKYSLNLEKLHVLWVTQHKCLAKVFL